MRNVLASCMVLLFIACSGEQPADSSPQSAGAALSSSTSNKVLVVNVSDDRTAQNETPLAVNPNNLDNLITGNNDWNYNDGCGVNASFDGGKTWTKTFPDGFLPGVTKYTNDPDVPGTGSYDFGGDPAVAFGPDGTAYFACFGYQAYPPYEVALLLSRSTNGGVTWTSPKGSGQPLTVVSKFTGNGQAKGSTGQFPDHESITVAPDGTIYATWAQFNGYGTHSPIYVATSVDNGVSFSAPQKVTSGTVRNDQDARIAINPKTGTAYLTFDNSIQGGKGTAMYVSKSSDLGATWSAPYQFGTFQNPVCVYPPYCFTISGIGEFRGPGSYPSPAIDLSQDRLFVAYTDTVGGVAQIFLTSAPLSDITNWTPQPVPAGTGDRINVEMSIEPGSGRIDLMTNDRSWSPDKLFDVTYLGSFDHGAHWTVRRVTPSSWDPSTWGVPTLSGGFRPFIGDYDGIVSLPNAVGMTWTGPGKRYAPTNLEVYFGRLTP